MAFDPRTLIPRKMGTGTLYACGLEGKAFVIREVEVVWDTANLLNSSWAGFDS
jgi:hypothetical protein